MHRVRLIKYLEIKSLSPESGPLVVLSLGRKGRAVKESMSRCGSPSGLVTLLPY